MQRAMEADTETGYLEVRYDPASQRRTHTYLNERYAALRGASRPALLARLAAHTADLPAPPPDFLAALLHALLRRRAATCTQHVRAACGGRGALLWEHSRKRFDGRGRLVKVRRRRRYCCSSAQLGCSLACAMRAASCPYSSARLLSLMQPTRGGGR